MNFRISDKGTKLYSWVKSKDEFKGLFKEALQTIIKEELTLYLGYEKHQESDNLNYCNGYNKKNNKN